MNTPYRCQYVDYYRRHHISPVRQDISDINKHFDRREALYRHLGLVPSLLKDRSVIELGPGSGHNSLYTGSLGPKRYVLVDGNITGLRDTQALLSNYKDTTFEFFESMIEDYTSDERFDIVLCEGVITMQADPPGVLRKVAGFVAPSGVLVITCIDYVACLTDILRRLLGVLATNRTDDTQTRLAKCLPLFRDHLNALPGMSRLHEDWIHDNILQPFLGRMISITEAIDTLADDFEVYGSSPRFITDWRWYKDIHGSAKQYNERAVEMYYHFLHNHLDYRFEFGPAPIDSNKKLLKACEQVFKLVLDYENERRKEYLNDIVEELSLIRDLSSEFSHETAISFEDFINVIAVYIDRGIITDCGRFKPHFGRGQQYLSFIRN